MKLEALLLFLRLLPAVGILGGGYWIYDRVSDYKRDNAVLTATNVAQAAALEQQRAAQKESERIARVSQEREREARGQAERYREQLWAATSECGSTPVHRDVDRLLGEITTPDGFAGVPSRARGLFEAGTDSALEVWDRRGPR